MPADEGLVDRLSALVGVADRYTDAFGTPVQVGLDRRRAMLAHLGYPAGSDAEARDSLRRAEALRQGLLSRLIPAEAGRGITLPLGRTEADRSAWRITDETGGTRDGQSATRTDAGRRVLRLPALSAGYYRLDVTAGPHEATATLIVAPPRCWQPDWIREGRRAWGIAAQVYSLRSAGDLGIGSYTALQEAARGAAPLGASFLGLSPVHALFSGDRSKTSPYSPSSRLFLETMHIDPTAIAGFAGSRAAAMLADEGRAGRIDALRKAALVDHAGVWAELSPVLEAAWTAARERRDGDFDAFRRQGGEALQTHAVFEALHGHFRALGRPWLGDWPEPFRSPSGPEVRRFAAEEAERVGFHAWLQYLADAQLGTAARAARDAGMSIGLYRDLAVGSDRGGSELWSSPGGFCDTLSIGAPPDLLAPHGQDWGLPPLHPLALEADGLAPFRDLVRANMRHAGAIRIDHAFQLKRLYLIPLGESGAAGAYVDYPFEPMLAVLRLESHRARALVIAEDLGTGPDGFSDAIMRSGLLSYRVLAFERDGDGSFKAPAAYPQDAMSVITTHDLPTFVGWWRGLDTDLRQTLGIYDPARGEAERAERIKDRAALAQALADEKLVASPEPPEEPPLEAVTRYLARTESILNAIQYEDVLGSLNQPNMPGTTEGHPNWRRRLELDLDAVNAPGGPLAKVAAAVSAEGRGTRAAASPLAAPPPRATYRFQFHAGFTFDDAVAVLPYLVELGISHIYASPIATARPGSTHGYDIVDLAAINPELGGEEGFERLSDALRSAGLGLILDIVPNHLGIGGADNAWWLSTLEWGQLSPHARAFDIDWERLGANGKLVVPVLGDRYGEALEAGDLRLAFDGAEGSFSVWHHEHRLPISPPSYPLVLDRALAASDDIREHAEIIAVSEALRSMAEEPSAERRAEHPAAGEALKRRLAASVAASPPLASALDRAVSVVNGVPGLPESFGTLHRILEQQAYRPAHWRVAASDINYRRFFDINGLAGLRVELPDVFEAAHALPFRLIREGKVQGLRIDHVDGLADPENYLRTLQAAVGPGFYIVVEKILEPGEPLRPWPVAGTTGYDVLNLIDGLFVDEAAGPAFDAIYRDFTGNTAPYGEQLRAAKMEVLQSSFASELEVLVSDLKRIADGDRRTRDYTVYAMRIALSEIVTRCPTYRSYITGDDPSAEDVELVDATVAAAKRESLLADRSLHDFVAAALLGRLETEGTGRPAPDHVARFRRRFQQLTGPVMAKSLEDTLFYRYGRLLSLNEVGGDPGHFGVAVDAFHAANGERSRAWPHGMIASATHDTKRGEDARARLSVLSEMPGAWREALSLWRDVAAPHLATADGSAAPDANDQYILLQAVLGAWPVELLTGDDPDALQRFGERLKLYGEKSLREAKRHSSWVNPNAPYEGATARLVDALLAPGSAFIPAYRPLAQRLAVAGAVNGLARIVLKCTLPGVPDVYQGTAGWDFSLVDPDNRRPVDHAGLAGALRHPGRLEDDLASWPDGRIKQRLLAALLRDRAASPALYDDGDYAPITPHGRKAAHVVAFARRQGTDALLVAVPRLPSALAPDGAPPVGDVWADTGLPVPAGLWRDVLTDRHVQVEPGDIAMQELFATLPGSVLRRAG